MLAGLLGLLAACSDQGLAPVPEACDEPELVLPAVPSAGCAVLPAVDPVPEPWAVRLLWEWPPEPRPELWQVYGSAAVGAVSDTDGDGAVTELDVPAVVIRADSTGHGMAMVALDGATGAERWRVSDYFDGMPTLADVDGDGTVEVLQGSADPKVLFAFRGEDGSELWSTQLQWDPATPFVADLDGDGRPEVLTAGAVLAGDDGRVLWETASGLKSLLPMVAADLDLDGQQEVLEGGVVYSSTGEERWRIDLAESWGEVRPMVVQADADPEGEVSWLGWTFWRLTDTDGTVLASEQFSPPDEATTWGNACAADFDGDGAVEVAWLEESLVRVSRLDRSTSWVAALSGNNYMSACAAFDFDGDGRAELTLADDGALHIFNGLDGAVLLEMPVPDPSDQVNIAENPTIADVDGDGHAEVLVTDDIWDENPPLRVYTHDGAGWPPAGPSWPTANYAGTNANAGGHVPRSPVPSWLSSNMWRGRPAADAIPLPDLSVSGVACPATGRVRLAIANRGAADAAGVSVVAYDGEAELDRVWLDFIEGGASTEGTTLRISAANGPVSLVVDEENAVPECDETNNSAELEP